MASPISREILQVRRSLSALDRHREPYHQDSSNKGQSAQLSDSLYPPLMAVIRLSPSLRAPDYTRARLLGQPWFKAMVGRPHQVQSDCPSRRRKCVFLQMDDNGTAGRPRKVKLASLGGHAAFQRQFWRPKAHFSWTMAMGPQP
jgi:hypothetical protein